MSAMFFAYWAAIIGGGCWIGMSAKSGGQVVAGSMAWGSVVYLVGKASGAI